MPSWNSYARGSPSAGITVTSIRFMVLKTTPLYAKKKRKSTKLGTKSHGNRLTQNLFREYFTTLLPDKNINSILIYQYFLE